MLAILEIVRFYALTLLASSVGILSMSAGIPSLWRYALVPQLLFALALFFMWFDYARYGSYRSLVLAGKIILLAVVLPLAIDFIKPGLAEPEEYIYLGILAVVDAAVTVLLFMNRGGRTAGPSAPVQSMAAGPEESAGGADNAGKGSGAAKTGADAGTTGPRGPEDIEKVE